MATAEKWNDELQLELRALGWNPSGPGNRPRPIPKTDILYLDREDVESEALLQVTDYN